MNDIHSEAIRRYAPRTYAHMQECERRRRQMDAKSKMLHGKYVGPLLHLRGETALLMRDESNPEWVKAQFDNLKLPMELTHAWVQSHGRDWEIDK